MPVKPLHYRFFLLLVLCSGMMLAQKTIVKGKVYDKETGEPLPFVNIAFKDSKIGTTSDIDGNYYIETYYATDTLVASYIGYKIFKVKIKKDKEQTVDIAMEPGAVALQEFVVKYTGNPAHEILKRVWKNRKANNREKYDAYEYEVYNKIEFDLNNITDEFKNRGIFKKIDFIFDYVDTTEEKPFLPMFMTEALSKYYYRREPKSEKEIIIATKVSGVENNSLQQFLGDMYQNVNIYENNIIIFGKSFVSPISIFGKRYYKYYLTDSGYIDNNYCYKLEFKPRFRAEPVFEGEMWINDTTYAVKSITAKMATDVNINFINDFRVKQEYVKVDGQYWMLKKDQLFIDFEVDKKALGIYGRKTTTYKNIVVNQPKPQSFFLNSDDIVISDSAQLYDESFWEKARHEQLSETEANIYHMVDTLKEVPVFKTFVDIMETAITGYYDVGKYLEVGPYFTLYSFNAVEGNRFRLGFRTSSAFSKNFKLGAYSAYGTKDLRYKFSAWTKIMINRKHWQRLTLSYKNDVMQLGVSSYVFQNGNLLSSIQRGNNNKLNNIEQYKIEFISDIWKGFSGKIILKKEISSPLGILSYQKTNTDGSIQYFNNVKATEATFYIRMAWKEKFVESDLTRASIGTKYPVVEALFTFGLKGVLDADYDYNKMGIAVSDKIYIGTMGYTQWRVEAGKIVGRVPWPLLKIHQGNETYFYSDNAYNLMNFFEFISDEYASLNVSHHFDGFFLNKIPLFRKLKWREVANFKALVGNTKKEHTEVMDFLPITYLLKQPYVETGVGVENIFKFIRIDYVWRLSYLDHPNISQYAFRMSLDFKF